MNIPELPDPVALRESFRGGQEEFTQRLLTCLILGRIEQGWNVPRAPSDAGESFLRRAHEQFFPQSTQPSSAPHFVDEYELRKRHDGEPSGWPDYGIVWDQLLFLIELKTDARSHRPAQVPYYMELAHHWHPEKHVDMLYLTPNMPQSVMPPAAPNQLMSHATWSEVAPADRRHLVLVHR